MDGAIEVVAVDLMLVAFVVIEDVIEDVIAEGVGVMVVVVGVLDAIFEVEIRGVVAVGEI